MVEACVRIGELALAGIEGLEIGARGSITILDPEDIVEDEKVVEGGEVEEVKVEEEEEDKVEVDNDVGLTIGKLKGVTIGTMTIVAVDVDLNLEVVLVTVDVTVVKAGV